MIRRSREILVVNTSNLEGWAIDRYIGPVSVHIVAGTDFFSDILARWTDVFGGRSGTYGNELTRLYADAVEQLRRRAEGMGANAIVGLSIDFDELSAQGKSMFMLNALGTAVHAHRTSDAVQTQPGAAGTVLPARTADALRPQPGATMDAGQMEALVRRNELLRMAEQKTLRMSDDVWSFITEYAVAELSPSVLGVFLNDLHVHDSAERAQAMQRARRYFAALDPEDAKAWLYRMLGHDTHPNSRLLRGAVVTLIRDLALVDFARIAQALESAAQVVRHNALALLSGHAAVYRAEDLPLLSELQRRITAAFPDRWAPVVRRGMLGKEKQVWECVCGGTVGEDDVRCGKCQQDRHGMREGELTVEAALAGVAARAAVLAEAVGRGVSATAPAEHEGAPGA